MSKRDEVREQIADILDENLIHHSIIQGEPVFILKNKLPRIADQILAIPDIAIISCLQCPKCGVVISEEEVKCQWWDKLQGEET